MKFHERFIIARQQIAPVRRRGHNPRFGSSYATLDDIIEAVMPALAANGLLLTQHVDGDHVTTRVTGGEPSDVLFSHVPICADTTDAQRYGSALTYARRYGLASLFCLQGTEEDDDGNNAQPQKPATVPPSITPVSLPANVPAAVPAAIDRLRQVVIPFGKNKGQPLGALSERSLEWYAVTWEPRFDERTGRVNQADEELKNAAKQLFLALRNPAALTDPVAAAQAAGSYLPKDIAPAVIIDEADGIPF